jgi:hypothetical protein
MENSELKEREDRKLRRLRRVVEFASQTLHQRETSLEEAVRTIEGLKQYALELFPGKERAWEMIYAPRLYRILEKRWDYVRHNEQWLE